MSETDFGGRSVVTFESRKATEMASLIVRNGGVPVSAPTIREVPVTENASARAFAKRLGNGGFDVVVLMTGTGTRALVEEVSPELDRSGFVVALARVSLLVARGPKPAQALRQLGIVDFALAPEPNTWREVMETIRARTALEGTRVAVQEHGAPSTELYAALEQAGAEVTPVSVYRWALPEDTSALRRALQSIAEGRAEIVLFTSRAQVEHAFTIAAEEKLEGAIKEHLRRGVIASIGPVCTEALRAEGLTPDVEPSHPKMGHLVRAAAEHASAILLAKSSH